MDTAKVFMNGASQAVRLPLAYRFTGKEVAIKRLGNAVLLIPLDDPWETLEQSLEIFSGDFMSERHQPSGEEREPWSA